MFQCNLGNKSRENVQVPGGKKVTEEQKSDSYQQLLK